jgi:hypothetical protein
MTRVAPDPAIMAALAAYYARGMTGPSPDRDLALVPDAVRADLLNGFTAGFWTPTKDEALSMDYEELLARQRVK